ncbi:uncharacterized protein ACJ7VT_013735 [Polymixia lowei]
MDNTLFTTGISSQDWVLMEEFARPMSDDEAPDFILPDLDGLSQYQNNSPASAEASGLRPQSPQNLVNAFQSHTNGAVSIGGADARPSISPRRIAEVPPRTRQSAGVDRSYLEFLGFAPISSSGSDDDDEGERLLQELQPSTPPPQRVNAENRNNNNNQERYISSTDADADDDDDDDVDYVDNYNQDRRDIGSEDDSSAHANTPRRPDSAVVETVDLNRGMLIVEQDGYAITLLEIFFLFHVLFVVVPILPELPVAD